MRGRRVILMHGGHQRTIPTCPHLPLARSLCCPAAKRGSFFWLAPVRWCLAPLLLASCQLAFSPASYFRFARWLSALSSRGWWQIARLARLAATIRAGPLRPNIRRPRAFAPQSCGAGPLSRPVSVAALIPIFGRRACAGLRNGPNAKRPSHRAGKSTRRQRAPSHATKKRCHSPCRAACVKQKQPRRPRP